MPTPAPAPPSEQPTQALLPGTRLNEFELLDVIGVGGFSIVYLAHDHALERRVALKEYMPGPLASRTGPVEVGAKSERDRETFDAGLKSFVNEARLLASFDHPSLLKVYRFWEDNGTAYMVMPLLKGRTLKQLLRERGEAPDETFLLGIVQQLGGALRVLHGQNVFHRDIAPDNVMLTVDGHWLLLDFGAARRVIGDLTQSLTVILKPGYAPIEQYAETPGMAQGPWTDIYALGALLHQTITGRPPPPSVSRLIQDNYRPLAMVATGRYSAPFLEAIDRALAVQPADRPRSMDALLAAMGLEPPEPAPLAPGRSPASAPSLSALEPLVAAPAPGSGGPVGGRVSGGVGGVVGWLLAPLLLLAEALGATWRYLTAPAETTPQAPPKPAPIPPASPPERPAANDGHTVIRPRPKAQPVSPRQATGGADGDADAGHTVILGPAPRAGAAGGELQIVVSGGAGMAGVQQVYAVRSPRVLIGRRETADLRLHDAMASAEHAVIESSADGWFVVDQGSRNGTYLGQRRLPPLQAEPLWLGASLLIGDTLLTLTHRSDTPRADLAGGSVGGLYLLQRRLRDSPKGAVYAAQQLRTGAVVAVKLLDSSMVGHAAYREQFEALVAAARQLQHPNICPLLDSGWDEVVLGERRLATAYLSYPLLTGGNLTDRIAERTPLPHKDVMAWLAAIAAALGHGHRVGVVHGDLKPSAICFDADGNVYVTDFATGSGRGAALLGSPPFMAPEQWQARPPNARTDQFALAAIAYTLLTGALPFEGQADPRVRERNFRLGPVDAHEEAALHGREALSPLASGVLRRALATPADERFDDIQAFVDELSRAIAAGPQAAQPLVFLSYRRGPGSTPVAHVLRRELFSQHRISCFLDSEERSGAGSFPDSLRQAISECRVFVCLLGGDTLQSDWVRLEIETAHARGRPMIPVMLESFRAPARDEVLPPSVDALLHSKGESLSDARGVLFDEGLARVLGRVRETLGLRPSPGAGRLSASAPMSTPRPP